MIKFKSISLFVFILIGLGAQAQDQLKKKTGITLEVKVEKLSKQEVSYTIGTDGKVRTISTTELVWIKLASEPDTIWYERAKPAEAAPVEVKPTPSKPSLPTAIEKKTVLPTASQAGEVPLPAGVRLAQDGDKNVYVRFDGKRVVLADSMIPLAKETMFDFGIGNLNPMFQFGDKSGNVLNQNMTSGHAGLGFAIYGSLDIRFNKYVGGHIYGQIAGNSIDNNRLAATTKTSDGNTYTTVTNTGSYLNYAFGIGPSFYFPITKYVDLMLQPGLGLSSHQNPTFDGSTNVVGAANNFTYSSSASTGFLLYGMAKFRCYIYKNVFAIGTLGYTQLQTRVNYTVTGVGSPSPGGSNSQVVPIQQLNQNILYGIGLGYGF